MRAFIIGCGLALGIAGSAVAQAQRGFEGTWTADLALAEGTVLHLRWVITLGHYEAELRLEQADGTEEVSTTSGAFGFEPPGLFGLRVDEWAPQTAADGSALEPPPMRVYRILGGTPTSMVVRDLGCPPTSGAPACQFELTKAE